MERILDYDDCEVVDVRILYLDMVACARRGWRGWTIDTKRRWSGAMQAAKAAIDRMDDALDAGADDARAQLEAANAALLSGERAIILDAVSERDLCNKELAVFPDAVVLCERGGENEDDGRIATVVIEPDQDCTFWAAIVQQARSMARA